MSPAGHTIAGARRARRGFTLVEAITTIAILAAVMGVTSTLVHAAVGGYASASVRAQLHAEASMALDRITKELQKIPCDGAASGPAPDIDALTATSIAWSGDWSLTLSGSELLLAEDGAAARPILRDVSALALAAFDQSNTALGSSLSGSACEPIRRIQVQLTVTRQGVGATLRTRVFVRSTLEGGA